MTLLLDEPLLRLRGLKLGFVSPCECGQLAAGWHQQGERSEALLVFHPGAGLPGLEAERAWTRGRSLREGTRANTIWPGNFCMPWCGPKKKNIVSLNNPYHMRNCKICSIISLKRKAGHNLLKWFHNHPQFATRVLL